MGEVVKLVQDDLERSPSNLILTDSIGKMDQCVVIGWAKDGEPYYASTLGDIEALLYLVERFKQDILFENIT
jgi:hypothetical protein